MRWQSASLIVSVLLAAGMADNQPAQKVEKKEPVADKPSRRPKEPEPFTSPELAVLDRFAGPWNVKESHYNARGEVIGSAKGIEEGAWILDRKVLRRKYTTGEVGSLFNAIGMITWDAAQKQYEGAWFDNSSTSGPTTVTGTWDGSAKTMTFTLSSTAPDGKTVQYKVVDRFLDDEHRVVTTFKVDGPQVQKMLEVQFSRAEPCPANVGIIAPEGLKDE